jgi:hypothetical protein
MWQAIPTSSNARNNLLSAFFGYIDPFHQKKRVEFWDGSYFDQEPQSGRTIGQLVGHGRVLNSSPS